MNAPFKTNNFQRRADAGFDVLSIIPPGAQLSPNSRLKPEHLGKIPGLLRDDGWVGFADWTTHVTTSDDIAEWSTWPNASVGINTKRMAAIDIDVTEKSLAKGIEDIALTVLGSAPRRIGNPPKRLLPYRVNAPIKKIRLQFSRDGEVHAVEILGDGQQFVVDGIHPKTSNPYVWEAQDEWETVELRYNDLTLITPEQIENFLAEVKKEVTALGYAVAVKKVGENQERDADEDFQYDDPTALQRAEKFLESETAKGRVLEGARDNTALIFSLGLRDLGLSETARYDFLARWNAQCCDLTDDDLDRLSRRPGQNKPGCDAAGDPKEAFAAYAGNNTSKRDTILEGSKQSASCIVLRDEVLQDQRQPPDYLIEGFLPKIGTAALHAPYNTYKSFTASDALLSVVSGCACFGKLAVRRLGPAIYLAGEGLAGFETLRRPAWRIARGIPADLKLPIYTVDGLPLVRSGDEVSRYIGAIEALKIDPALIVIDPVARAMAGLNENDAGDAGRYVEMVDFLAKRFQCCVLSILHEGKEEGRGPRGSSAFPGGFDSVWRQEADTERLVAKLTSVKQKDGADPDPIHLQGRQVLVPAVAKTSLVFDAIAADDFKAINRKNSTFQRSDIGAALIALNAVKGTTVSTRVLAMELAGPDADESTIAAKERSLRRSAQNKLRAYVAHLGEGRGDATLWSLPNLENAGGANVR